jgi:hypothetical protein
MPIVDEMMRATAAGLDLVALAVALTLPDICAALEAPNGRATGDRYKAWLKEALKSVRFEDRGPAGGPPENETDLIYNLRCSFLHQGNVQHPKSDATIKFTTRSNAVVVHTGFRYEKGKLVDAIYSTPDFVRDIANSVIHWVNRKGEDEVVLRNLQKFARVRPDGLAGLISGVTIVA